jgi:hypothetical protein
VKETAGATIVLDFPNSARIQSRRFFFPAKFLAAIPNTLLFRAAHFLRFCFFFWLFLGSREDASSFLFHQTERCQMTRQRVLGPTVVVFERYTHSSQPMVSTRIHQSDSVHTNDHRNFERAESFFGLRKSILRP